jgi:hypothetical protein
MIGTSAHLVAHRPLALTPRSLYNLTKMVHTRLPREFPDMIYPHLHAAYYVFNISDRDIAYHEKKAPKMRRSDKHLWQRQQQYKTWILGEYVLRCYVDPERVYKPFSQGLVQKYERLSPQDLDNSALENA